MEMGSILLDIHRSLEGSFGGSMVLLLRSRLRECLQVLVGMAWRWAVTPPVPRRKLDAEVKQFDTIALKEV